jgi:transcription initiation factor TFIIIB Brf1 subunit/transcription initiation factor TFIIB
MSHPENICSHLNNVIDEREGSVVCTDCGLVLEDKFFKFYDSDLFSQDCGEDTSLKNEVKEILSKLQLPDVYCSSIIQNFKKDLVEKKNKKELLAYVVYKTLNENNIPVSIKDISAISGFSDINIYDRQESNKTIILQPCDLLEKYCRYLNLDYKTYSVIKNNLPIQNLSGHNPLTIIAASIYSHCKQNNIKISMKKVASTVKISCVSIQRYLKNKS